MAITPLSDIVLDVARAADPEKYRAAVERLSRLRAAEAGTEPFMTSGDDPSSAPGPPNLAGPMTTSSVAPLHPGASVQSRRRLDPYGQFESFVLQTFVQSMLPKNATNVFGKGSAGEFWKSMLAEKMGDELARSGQIGIARRLAAGPVHPVHLDTAATATSPTAPPAPLASTLTRLPLNTENIQSPDAAVTATVPSDERS